MADNNFSLQGILQEDALYQLLKKEHSYYKAILKLSHEEHEILTSHQATDELHPIIKKQKMLLSCIHDVETALSSIKELWKRKKDKDSPFNEKIENEVKSLITLLQEILKIDSINQRLLKKLLSELRIKLDLEAKKSFSTSAPE